MGSALISQQTPAASHPTTWMTGALLNSCIWLEGCSRKPYPPHVQGNVLPPTVEPPASTPFRPPLPPWPTALQTFRHARVPPACTWLRSLPWLPREAIHHLPELPFACSVLESTRHMARTRAPDKHAKIFPGPFTLPRALAGPRPAQNLHKA